MAEMLYGGSDAVRSAKPLGHAQVVTFDSPMMLEHGGKLPEVRVCYETYGKLNAAKNNAVLICHALSGDSHVARHDEGDDPGWWEVIVGPGKAIDTDKYFVICPNILGGCRGTTGPGTVNPKTGKPYGGDFPVVTVRDIVEVQRRLVEHLGIGKLRAAVGGSMGGHAAMTWATTLPERVAGVIVLASCARLTNQSLGFDIVGRNAILRDPHFAGGDYYGSSGGPGTGLAVARMLAHITYLSHQSMAEKFDADRLQPRQMTTEFETRFSIGSYLAYQGHRFVERFDANSYITLTMAMDLFDLGNTPQKLAANLSRSHCRWMIVSFSSDWLFPPFQSEEITHALVATNRPVTYCEVTSSCGHDAFLLSDDMDRYGELMRAFLGNLGGGGGAGEKHAVEMAEAHSPTSIFHGDRLDYDILLDLIPAKATVLDLGCGTGGLLERLRQRGHKHVLGIELDELAIVACAQRGVDAIRFDLNRGLGAFADDHFDVVVLSRTLQTIRDVEKVLAECIRVGRRVIVSFPNIAHEPLRKQLMDDGRAPRGTTLQGSTWYNTPDIRFLSIADFEAFCREKGVRVLERVALDTAARRRVTEDANRGADLAIFVISR